MHSGMFVPLFAKKGRFNRKNRKKNHEQRGHYDSESLLLDCIVGVIVVTWVKSDQLRTSGLKKD